jgi:hypothetical protein
MNEMNGSQAEPRALTLVERAEVGSAIGTGILAFAYVSGYLTATTHLGTYAIPADTSEIFRAKYIYISFEYCLFVAIFGVCFYVAGLVVNLFKVSRANDEQRKRERDDVTRELVARRLLPGALLPRMRQLRWGWAMALISIVFSFEIMFMRPMEFRGYLAIQAVFLLFFSLYQTTFYREYAKESYAWGVISGRRLVRWIRWVYSLVFGSICAALILGKALYFHIDKYSKLQTPYNWASEFKGSLGFRICAGFVTLLTLLVASFVTLATDHLKWADERAQRWGPVTHFVFAPWYILCALLRACTEFVRPVSENWNRRDLVRWVLWTARPIDSILMPVCAAAYCVIAWLVFTGEGWRILPAMCGYLTLVFSLVVLTNILWLYRMHQLREQDLGIEAAVREAGMAAGGSEKRESRGGMEGWMTVVRLVVPVTVLYLVSVLGFAHLIYPFIPIDKAGGNYSTDGPIFVGLNNESAERNSKELSDHIPPDSRFYVIEEVSDWIYLAPAGSGQGPDCWKWGTFCKLTPKEMSASYKLGAVNSPQAARSNPIDALSPDVPFRPRIYQVNRRCISSINSVP